MPENTELKVNADPLAAFRKEKSNEILLVLEVIQQHL